ncbi:MAG: hypothetical protein GXO14_02840 [Thermococci archaeon]|nr:hypothetical protein [Thermococci archaeon]
MKMKLKRLRWYLRGLFPTPTTEVLVAFMWIAAYFAVSDIRSDGQGQFVAIVEYIFLPVYGMLMAAHVFRDSRTTAFELSLFEGPGGVYVWRIIALTLGLLPGIAGVAVITALNGYPGFIPSIAVRFINYVAIAAIIMAVLDSMAAVITFYAVTSALPMAFSVLLQHPPQNGGWGPLMSSIAYFLSPMTSYEYHPFLCYSPTGGLMISTAISLTVIGVAYLIFSRREFAP